MASPLAQGRPTFLKITSGSVADEDVPPARRCLDGVYHSQKGKHRNSHTIDHVVTVHDEKPCTPCISRNTHPLLLKIFTSKLADVYMRYIQSDFFPLCTRDSRGQKVPKSTHFDTEPNRINFVLI